MFQVMYSSAHDAVVAERMGPAVDEGIAPLPRPRRRVPRTTTYRKAWTGGGVS